MQFFLSVGRYSFKKQDGIWVGDQFAVRISIPNFNFYWISELVDRNFE